MKFFNSEKTGHIAKDEQTGKIYELEKEGIVDVIAANFSFIYLTVILCFLVWVLTDLTLGDKWFLSWIGVEKVELGNSSASPLLMLFIYAVIGGGLGAVVKGIRSCIFWHPEKRAFSWRFVWKYITLPPLGATLAAFVFAITRSGLAALGGEATTIVKDSVTQSLSAFAIGALSGYGTKEVAVWLTSKVEKFFKTPPPSKAPVPSLTGRTETEAE
jgi:hypothetical protein